ncbi:MAG: VOC family protein [Betaproteobacteria bacterium]|nr:VOC family protein [Betaproteobacteria bacterium]MDH5577027.1 VOC family protein [Betaproteobacteria bacterium]
MAIQPYLFFEGRTEEALEFYKKALGAQVQMVMRYRDAPGGPTKFYDGSVPPGEKIMHSAALIGGSLVMASDGFCTGKPQFSGITLSFEATDEADAKKRFDALSAGGKVNQPVTETFFAKAFGMVTDKFGVSWMIIAEQKATK